MPLPKNKKNDQYERLERREQVAALYVRGATQWAIARKLGVSQGTVSNDLAAIRKDWLASTLRDFDARKAEELAKLDAIEREAWAAWERSCKDAETKHERADSVRAMPTKAKGKSKAKEKARLVLVRRILERTTKTQVGDPRFLERAAWCVETRLKLMGLMKHSVEVKQTNSFEDMFTNLPDGPVPDAIEAEMARLLGNVQEPKKIECKPSSNGTSHHE